MISEIFTGLYVGPGDEVKRSVENYRPDDDDVTDNLGILNVADDYTEFPHHRSIFYAHAGLNDGPADWSKPWGDHNSYQAYVNAILMLDHMMCAFRNVIVHCHGGVSRSCFVIAMYLTKCFRCSYEDAKRLVSMAHSHAHIHPKHDDRANGVMGELYQHQFWSVQRMRDAAIVGFLQEMGVEDMLARIFMQEAPRPSSTNLRVLKGGADNGGESSGEPGDSE